MSRHPLPNPTAQPGWHPFTILRILAVAGGVVSAAIGTAIAADPVPPSGTVTTPSAAVKDVALARSALAAIDAAADLKGVNLVVSVVDGIAVIGGPVASEKQSRRAEEVVRGVTGIVDVRNSCFVAAGPDPLLRSVAQRMGSTLPPRPTLYQVPGVLTNHLTPPAPYAEAIENRAVAMAATTSRETVVARRPPVEPGILGPPVSPAGIDSTASLPEVPHATPGLLTGNASGVLLSANNVKKSEPRFSDLTVELRNGILVIGGSAPKASDAWDFAKKLQSIPGLNRVVVTAVAAK